MHRQDPLRRARSPDEESEQPSTHRVTSIWTAEDDEILIAARAKGLNWAPIASLHFPDKTGNACRKRHERLMEKRNAEDWSSAKLERLAVAYMNMRKDIWNPLAVELGEKWQHVEAKCMEKGIKNISAVYRSAMRKDRGGMAPLHQYNTQYYFYPSPISPPGIGEYESYAEYGVGYGPTTAPAPLAPSITVTSGHPLGYMPANPNVHLQRRQSYGPMLVTPQPTAPPHAHGMMMGYTAMHHPVSQGRHMSIHSMLSPSPPADDDDDGNV